MSDKDKEFFECLANMPEQDRNCLRSYMSGFADGKAAGKGDQNDISKKADEHN